MSINTQQLAELLAGIVRAQQSIIDGVESIEAGWRNTHLLPKLNVAANLRLAQPRLIDYPSRILLRSQGRVPLDVATIARDLDAILAGGSGTPAVSAGTDADAGAETGTAASAKSELDFS